MAEEVLEQAALGTDPEEGDLGASGAESTASVRAPGPGDRNYRREVPMETLGEAIVDERLGMFRDFINSLDKDQGKS